MERKVGEERGRGRIEGTDGGERWIGWKVYIETPITNSTLTVKFKLKCLVHKNSSEWFKFIGLLNIVCHCALPKKVFQNKPILLQ